MGPILPGATIGILGGGQLGRMMALAARTLGYDVHVLDPDPECAARAVADRTITAPFDDEDAAADLARGCDVVTLEIERVAIGSMRAAGAYAPVRPGPWVLDVVQHRGRQKEWLAAHGFPVGAYQVAGSPSELDHAMAAMGGICFIKASTGGYDGRGQMRVDAGADAAEVWRAIGASHCVVEQGLDLAAELSVMVARRPGGEAVVYEPALNHHEEQVLAWSVMPAPVPVEITERAKELGLAIATALDVHGLLGVEMFLTRDGALLVNELAPRPHNSFHHSEMACITSQFEQAVRSVCDLPLGSTEIIRPAALVNLFGDLWLGDQTPPFDRALQLEGVRLNLYGKKVARPGRKMGHLTAIGVTPQDAVARAHAARAALTTKPA